MIRFVGYTLLMLTFGYAFWTLLEVSARDEPVSIVEYDE